MSITTTALPPARTVAGPDPVVRWAAMALARELTVLSLPVMWPRTSPALPVLLSRAALPVDQ